MPTTQTLTPTPFVKNFAGLNITSLLAPPTQLVLQFSNSGKEILFVSASSGVTVQVNIGTTVLGQAVTQPTAVTLTTGDVYAFGPYDSQVDEPGTTTVQVTLSATSGVDIALLQMVGAA